MSKTQKIREAFSNPSWAAKFILYSFGLLAFFGFLTALIPNTLFSRMTQITELDYFFLVSTSLLGGVYLALPSIYCKTDKTAAGGSLLGFLAFACPTCNKLLVLMAGFAFVNGVFDPLRPVFGILSVALLLHAINGKLGGKDPLNTNPYKQASPL